MTNNSLHPEPEHQSSPGSGTIRPTPTISERRNHHQYRQGHAPGRQQGAQVPRPTFAGAAANIRIILFHFTLWFTSTRHFEPPRAVRRASAFCDML